MDIPSKRAVAASKWVPHGDSCDALILSAEMDLSAKPFFNSDRRESPNENPHARAFISGFLKKPEKKSIFYHSSNKCPNDFKECPCSDRL